MVEVVRRLWDSWEDDAEIRDVATGRFIDRDKLHYVDFEGQHFSVRGPSITPRPPQGQPVVTVLAHARVPYELAARAADVVFVTPHDDAGAQAILTRGAGRRGRGRAAAGCRCRSGPISSSCSTRPRSRGADRSAAAGRGGRTRGSPTPPVVAGTAAALADQIAAWHELGYAGVGSAPRRCPTTSTSSSGTSRPSCGAAACPAPPTTPARCGACSACRPTCPTATRPRR